MLERIKGLLTGSDDRVRARRDALTAFVVRVASAGILYLSQVALARWMGGTDYGIYVYVWTWVLVLGGVSHLGLNMGVMRLAPELREQGDLDLLRGLLSSSRWLTLAVATLIATGGGAVIWILGSRIASPYLLPLALALICVPIYALTDLQDGIGRGQRWMATALVPPYVLRPLVLLALVTAAHYADLPTNATTAVLAAIAATWIAGAVQTVLVETRLAREVPRGPGRYQIRVWIASSLPLLVVGAGEILLQNTDVLVLSQFVPPDQVAIYFAAAKTMSLVMFVHYAVGSAVANRLATLNARGDRAALESFVADAVRWTFWPSLAAALVLLAVGWPLLALFGERFTDGYPIMLVLVLGFLTRSAFGPGELLLNMLGEQRRLSQALAAAALLNIGLNLALVPLMGMLGAAAATALSLATVALLNARIARRRLGLETSILATLARRRSGVSGIRPTPSRNSDA
jgi:O-antigen/teichoic acid export membrane protein